MKKLTNICACALFSLLSLNVWAGDHSAEEVKQDIERHRAMAAAHTAMAQCMEAAGADKTAQNQCQKELLAACKGLAVGKYCGMKHAH